MDEPLDGVIDAFRAGWSQRFAGGMLPFDRAYGVARARPGTTIAEAQKLGVDAVLDAFCEGLKAELGKPHD